MAGGADVGERSLKETPTWAVAVVCAVFIIISVLIEHGIHTLEKWFHKKHKKAMSEALEKIKAELMLLGFLSLLLTFGTKYVAKICIPSDLGNIMLPCKKGEVKKESKDDRRRLLSFDDDNMVWRRNLAAAAGDGDYCSQKDQVSLISQSGVHQLHIFIFVLAVFHIFYSVMTMVLARAKMQKWKAWEAETSSVEYQFTHDPARFRFAHQTTFVRRHSGWTRKPGIRWISSFMGFCCNLSAYERLQLVHTHLALISAASDTSISRDEARAHNLGHGPRNPRSNYNCQRRTRGRAQQQNAFQIAYFLWTWYEFKITSCFHENLPLIITRVVLGVGLQVLCSYITFPLYALVTQMGSHWKRGIFEEQTTKALKKWRKTAKEKTKLRNAGSMEFPSPVSGENTPSQGTSPMHLLHKFKPSNQTETDSVLYSPRSYQSDTDFSDTEGSTQQLNLKQIMSQPEQHPAGNNQQNHNIDFSFDKP
ncbi:hypothetical protein TSUD_311070 [Trifolium subterraneum]|uniref:MLO-like protein n=1 Tax=Trifolium subterraneum TaxID=3900 RepID=A0A2Z6MBX0_TRISU|nr:hypothetical protein TSUD_311070 [Trifolium subterraneum]